MKHVAPSAILTSAEQMLAKLRWEIDALRAEGDETIGKYRHWNCVMTAWHAVDILHKTMPDPLRQRLAAVIGFDITGKDGLQQFQAYLRQFRPAALAQQFANSSKHFFVSKHTDVVVSDTASAVGTIMVARPFYRQKILDGSDRLVAADVLDEVHQLLTSFL
jgi:hypothetical protein